MADYEKCSLFIYNFIQFHPKVADKKNSIKLVTMYSGNDNIAYRVSSSQSVYGITTRYQ